MIDLNNYIATENDLNTIEDAIRFVWQPQLTFIFKDKTKIKQTIVISYDSKNIYLWINQKLNKIPHGLTFEKNLHSWWRAGLHTEDIRDYLPKELKNKSQFEKPIISGGLLRPFIELQKAKKRNVNPYVTRESYLATIIHEFGHAYYSQHKLWWFSSKKENLTYISYAIKAFEGRKIKKIALRSPNFIGENEIFAFCAEYCASRLFFINHKLNLDKFYSKRLHKLFRFEKNKNLNKENSVLDNAPYHDTSAILGILLIIYFPKSWPNKLLFQSKHS